MVGDLIAGDLIVGAFGEHYISLSCPERLSNIGPIGIVWMVSYCASLYCPYHGTGVELAAGVGRAAAIGIKSPDSTGARPLRWSISIEAVLKVPKFSS